MSLKPNYKEWNGCKCGEWDSVYHACVNCRMPFTDQMELIHKHYEQLQAQLALKNHPVLLWQENKKLQEQVAELAKDRAFFRSCALSGEIPECGSEPSALEQKP